MSLHPLHTLSSATPFDRTDARAVALVEVGFGHPTTLRAVGGERAFRRRLMELGLVPGTTVELVSAAPLGDPYEIRVRGCRLSIRRADAEQLLVDEPLQAAAK